MSEFGPVPPGEFIRLQTLITDLDLQWPWPFTSDQFTELLNLLPAGARDAASRRVVYLARAGIGKLLARRKDARGKGAPRPEIERVAAAATELMEALGSLSDEAIDFLDQRRVHGLNGQDVTHLHLKATLGRFLHMNRGLRDLPPATTGERRGRVVNDIERNIVRTLRMIFEEAHGSGARGFPAFRTAFVGPLVPHGLAALSDKAWQDAEADRKRPAVRRNKSPKSDI